MSASKVKFCWRRVADQEIPEGVTVLVWDREHGWPTFAVRDDGYLLDAKDNAGITWDDSTWWAEVPPPPGEREAR